jgi:hypothetical protein
MSEIIVPRRTLYRAQARLAQAEAIVDAFSRLAAGIAKLFERAPPAKGETALAIRRAWLRASA